MAYIVKNCPALTPMHYCFWANKVLRGACKCGKITDCPLKKQISLLKEELQDCVKYPACKDCFSRCECISKYAGDLLEHWQIEEVKDNAG